MGPAGEQPPAVDLPEIERHASWSELFFDLVAVAAVASLAHLLATELDWASLGLYAVLFLAVWLVRDATWISFPALGSTIIVTHLGLLFWEMKYVALSLSQPGLKTTAP